MNTHLTTTVSAVLHAIAGVLHRVRPLPMSDADDHVGERDRGAVSIETVLWYAAAAVSVAVVAAIIWNQIRSTASTGVDVPSAP